MTLLGGKRWANKNNRAALERDIAEDIYDRQRYNKGYKRFFACYVYRYQPRAEVYSSDLGTFLFQDSGAEVVRVEVGVQQDNYVDFRFKDKAHAYAVELLLKGLCFRIHFREPR